MTSAEMTPDEWAELQRRAAAAPFAVDLTREGPDRKGRYRYSAWREGVYCPDLYTAKHMRVLVRIIEAAVE